MQVEIKIDENCVEPKVVILTNRMTDDIEALVQMLSVKHANVFVGFKDEVAHILDPADTYRIFTSSGKVFAETAHGTYLLKCRLYEAEQRLEQHFVRISNSEIINLKKVKNFDLSLSGTICVKTINGSVAYASRRYVTKIKLVLGL